MNEYESLNHTKWECKYHVVFIPKYRRKALYGSLRKHLGSLFRELARQRECEIGEGHLMVDHVHMLLSIPPKYSVSQVMGYMKGKSANPRREAKELCGAALLGAWVLGIDGRTQRSRCPKVYPRTRERGPTPRSVGTVRWPKPL
jgi:putative transposase